MAIMLRALREESAAAERTSRDEPGMIHIDAERMSPQEARAF